MISMNDQRMVGLLFHELAHQKFYVKGDTQFNESFATLVQQEGVMRWIDSRQGLAAVAAYRQDLARHEQAWTLIRRLQRQLQALYASDQIDIEKLAAKAAIFEAVQVEYLELSADWPEPVPFSGWFSGPINNASLAALFVYDDHVPALRALLQQSSGDLAAFYQRVTELAEMELEERRDALIALEG